MKRIAILLSLLTSPFFASAAAVNINVSGTVTAMPCVIDNTDYLIDLKKVNRWNIKDTQVSPWVDFSIKLKNCPVNTKQAAITLTGTADPINDDFFKNTGTATNVALNLVSGPSKDLVKNNTTLTSNINTQTRTVEFPFFARMIGYGSGMTPGTFASHLEFTMNYN